MTWIKTVYGIFGKTYNPSFNFLPFFSFLFSRTSLRALTVAEEKEKKKIHLIRMEMFT